MGFLFFNILLKNIRAKDILESKLSKEVDGC